MNNNTQFSTIVLVFLLIFTGFFASADDRDEPIDVMIVMDKSLSMVEEINAVKEYIMTYIVDQYLQAGDFFLVISFYGDSVVPISTYIRDEAHKEEIKERISRIEADGQYTDIGYALDRLKEELELKSEPGRDGLLILMTDYLHNPRPDSKYYSEDKTFYHEYLDETKEIIQEGWKVIFLNIGERTSEELYEELKADKVVDVPDEEEELTGEMIDEMIGEKGLINIDEDAVTLSPINQDGEAILYIPLRIERFIKPPEIIINEIWLDSDKVGGENLLEESFIQELPAEGEQTLEITLHFKDYPDSGDYEGILHLVFGSEETFPGTHTVSFHINTIFENFPWFLPVAIPVLIIILALIIFLLSKAIKSRKISFRMVVEEQPEKKGKNVFKLAFGKNLFLMESMEMFRLTEKKSSKSSAQIQSKKKGLKLTVLKEDCFPSFIGTMDNILGKKFVVRSDRGNDFHIRFDSA